MTTNISKLNKRLANMAEQTKVEYKAIPAPELRYVPFPLNDMQQAYWIGRSSEIDGGGTAIQYYIEFAMSHFDETRFNSALNSLVARHDMLRVVVLPNGTQQVLENPPLMNVIVEDISGHNKDSQPKRLKEICDDIWCKTSDLTQWPQSEFRYTVTDSNGGGILHCKLDMWCFDGRSFQIFFEELATLYHDPAAQLRPLELRFSDYMRTVWEEEKGDIFARDLAYWKNRLKTLPPPPALPMAPGDQSPPEGGSLFTTREFIIPADVTTEILQACSTKGVSLTSFMAAVYSEILSLWSGQKSLTLNFPRFNRQLDWHPDVTDMIGEFASFTLLESHHEEGSTFIERVQKLQERMWEDLEHGSVSGLRVLRERIIETGQPEMQAMPIVFTAMPDRRSTRDALENAFAAFGDILSCRGATPQVWLDCQYFVLNGELTISWDSQDHVFPKGMIEEMFSEYIRVLTMLSDESKWHGKAVARIPEGQFEMRKAQNNLPMELTGGNAFQLFKEKAQNLPEQPALICGSTSISYGELYSIALRLASSISPYAKKENKPQSTECVAVMLKRGWEQQAAIMGIIAAGFAYLPLDPTLPAERLETILGAAKPCLLISDESILQATSQTVCPVANFTDLMDKSASQEPAELEQVFCGPENNSPAYLIFTSGSTGIPKGITVGHQALLNLVEYSNNLFELGADDAVFAITAIHHDLSVYDIFGTLAAGARLIIPTQEDALSPEQWVDLTVQNKITFWNSVPMFMEQLLASTKGDKLPLKQIVLGGDWVDPGILSRMDSNAPYATLYTIGGPTETTVWNIINKVDQLSSEWDSLPYGRPISNASYYILNEELRDAPDWVQGEMYCGGTPLCQSASLNKQENELAFAVHPVTGELIYRTGDLGRYRPEGVIEIMGRKDFQLNINGYRLDPSEVEQAIVRNESVDRVIVAATSSSFGTSTSSNVLTAFVKPAPKTEHVNLESTLRKWANELLPVSMRPRRWVFLNEFPLTLNGKLDRKALSRLAEKESPDAQDSQRKPNNTLESYLLEVWEEVLQTKIDGVRSSFFELGGDSLKAIQVFTRIEKKLGIRLSLAQMFLTPTVEELAIELYRKIEETVNIRKAQ